MELGSSCLCRNGCNRTEIKRSSLNRDYGLVDGRWWDPLGQIYSHSTGEQTLNGVHSSNTGIPQVSRRCSEWMVS